MDGNTEMTHDELLAEIDRLEDLVAEVSARTNAYPALRAVVELHKPTYWQNPTVPEWNGANCTHCLEDRGDYLPPIEANYPCPTIQAIEKELG